MPNAPHQLEVLVASERDDWLDEVTVLVESLSRVTLNRCGENLREFFLGAEPSHPRR
jgi:hypothetical protein